MFLLAAFTLAGTAQTAWFAAPLSRAFALPLDGGAILRGRPVFGPNKTLRGFVVMVPAASAAFAILAALAPGAAERWLWPMSLPSYALAGAWAGFGFMAGELPNSFLKRQLDVAPGSQRGSWAGRAITLLDQGDLVIGIWVCLLPIHVLSVPEALLAFVVISAIHFAVNVVGFAVGARTARV